MAYVSWNGATEVRAWRLKTGTTSDSLEPDIDSVEKTGLKRKYLSTRAVDSSPSRHSTRPGP